MADNLAVKKSPVDHVLECPLCLHQLTFPQTLQQCLHSYCKSCLDKVPQKTQEGGQGSLCPMCENFTKCDQVKHNTFIEELKKIHNEPEHCDEIKCEQCSEDCGPATCKCAECKIGLCENAKIAHLRIPMLKGHKVVPLDSDGEKLIDDIVFCKTHEGIPTQLNCNDCNKLICYNCNITEHRSHTVESVEQALERILPDTESSAKQVDENIDILVAQIKGVKKQIEQTRESYASCRMQMDDHLEKVISQMRAMKAQMEEDINEQESIALDMLKELKQQLENQLSQARVLSDLTAVVTTKTRHTSQLRQLQTGLFKKVKAIGASKKEEIHFELPEAKFIEGNGIKEGLEKVFGGLKFDLKGTNISTSGEVWVNKDDNFLCHDLEATAGCNFDKSLEIDTEGGWCNRLSLIDNKLWLPQGGASFIKLYNKDGNHEKNIDTGEKEINVVREAYNGDLICGGNNGLYITSKDFTQWIELAEGGFSDIVVQQRSFFVLDYVSECIGKYGLTKEGQWQCIQKHKLVADEPEDFKLDENSTLCVSGDHVWVNSSENTELYKFSDEGKHLQMLKNVNVNPVFCQIDDKGKVLIADFGGGNFHLLDTKQEEEIAIKEIWKSVSVEEVRDACFDSGNNELWIISGNETLKLTKFTQNRPL